MQQPSVLLVDGDLFQRQTAQALLATQDLVVTAVANAAQLRRQVSRAMPDLVLLDLQMPDREDGFALTRWLRDQRDIFADLDHFTEQRWEQPPGACKGLRETIAAGD